MTPSVNSSDLADEEQALLAKHLNFYRALASGQRKAVTPAQVHFVSVTLGRVPAETPPEIAYVKYMRLQRTARRRSRDLATLRDSGNRRSHR